MKKTFLFIFLLLSSFVLISCGGQNKKENTLDKIEASVNTWGVDGLEKNTTYQVFVSENGSTWTEVEVYNVHSGHQLGDQLLRYTGATFFGTPNNNSLVMFDFNGTVGIKIVCSKNLSSDAYVLSPLSYNMKSVQDGNTVTFTVTQDDDAPRKIVFRPNDSWDNDVLHIVTNKIDDSFDKDSSNVYKINNGDAIPYSLPEGYDTYYFGIGSFDLPNGYWVELDLDSMKNIKAFNIETPNYSVNLPGGLCYRLEAFVNDTWTPVYESIGSSAEYNYTGSDCENQIDNVVVDISAQKFRLILLGNFNYSPINDYRYVNKAYIYELSLFDETGTCVSLGKAVDGSGKNYEVVTDGNATEMYGHDYAKEAFFLKDNYNIYLEKGSHVYGALASYGQSNIKVFGRGVLDCSKLENKLDLSEGRSSGIRFEKCNNVIVSGITMLDSPMWQCVINESENILIDSINLFGWSTNADGIHFSASKNAVATGCFIRTTDDIFVAYHYGDAYNLNYKNSVVWSDGGRVCLFGLAKKGNIDTVNVENIDVITFQNVFSLELAGGGIQIAATGGKTIKNVKIKDFRVEEVRCPKIAPLIQIKCGYQDYGSGFVEDVLLENISYASNTEALSLIDVVTIGGNIKGIIFKNVSIGGEKLTYKNIYKLFEIGDSVDYDFMED